MELDPVFLSRVQFAFVVSFHIIFPAFIIGLAAWLAPSKGCEQPAVEVLIGWPDEKKERNLYAITAPKLGSLIASGTWVRAGPG